MGLKGIITFLENEHRLDGVDDDFKELIRLLNSVPGFATFGVSCAGHPNKNHGEDEFWAKPYAHLGFIALPEKEHIPELIQIIYEEAKKDPDASLEIKEKMDGWIQNQPRYTPETDLKQYSLYTTVEGLGVNRLELLIRDAGSMAAVGDQFYCQKPISKKDIETFEKTNKRYEQIRDFWKGMEEKVRAYNLKHGFNTVDFKKDEFNVE